MRCTLSRMIKNIPLLYSILLIANAFLVAPSYAEQETDDADLGTFIEPKAWKEDGVIIPPYPKTDDLIQVEVDRAEMPFDFYIDAKNISVSSGSGIIRYTVLIESSSGAKNVLFEGIRCATREFRTYAYGTYDNKLVKARTSNWEYIRDTGFMVHRYNFYRHYMCNEYLIPNRIDVVLQKVKYPDDFESAGEREY